MEDYDFEQNIHRMWGSWLNGTQTILALNIGLLVVFSSIGILSNDIQLDSTQAVFVTVYFISSMTTIMLAFLTRASGEAIMELHLTGGVDNFRENIEKRGLSERDVNVYTILNNIPFGCICSQKLGRLTFFVR